MDNLFNQLEYYQSHGGILAIAIVGFAAVFIVRALDWFVWRRELKAVSRKASSDVGQHEINYHHEELLKRATKDRRGGNPAWTGEERRAA